MRTITNTLTSTNTLTRVLLASVAIGLLCGCGGKSDQGGGILRAGLPPQAKQVAQGTDQLTFSPEEPGRVFIYDVDRDQVTGRYQLRRGQRLAMDAKSGRATIDGNEVQVGAMKNAGTYEIYYLPDAM